MARPHYDAEKEHEVVGAYPAILGVELGGTGESFCCIPETPKLYRPIPVYENFKMLFRGETPYWIPNNGWFFCDTNEFRPRQHPDNMANHQAIDGGPSVDYKALGNVVKGWFDLPLLWNEDVMGATVHPGEPMLEEMCDWQDTISMPNLDDMDWDEIAEMNKDFLASDKINQLGIQFGFWERMMNLMDVSNAAMALLDEDQEDDIYEFLDQLSDVYVDYIQRMSKIGRIDSVMLHDDWGTQNGPFFSLATARKFFVKPMKKVIDCCHELDIVFEHHCCGNAFDLVPAMEEAGVDYWFPQPAINNLDRLIETYKDYHITFSVSSPFLTKGIGEEGARKLGKEFVDKYKDKGILFCEAAGLAADPNYDGSLYPAFKDAVYEYSRIAYQDVED